MKKREIKSHLARNTPYSVSTHPKNLRFKNFEREMSRLSNSPCQVCIYCNIILYSFIHSFFSLFLHYDPQSYRTEKESRLLRKNVSLISYLINIARVRVSTKEKQGDDHHHITKTSDDDAHTCHGVACQKVWSTHIHVYTYTNIPHTPRSKSKTRIHALMTRKRPLFTHSLTLHQH